MIMRGELYTVLMTFGVAFVWILFLPSFDMNVAMEIFSFSILLKYQVLALRSEIYVLFLYLYLFELTRGLWRQQPLAPLRPLWLWICDVLFHLHVRSLVPILRTTFILMHRCIINIYRGLFHDLWAVSTSAWSRRVLLSFYLKFFGFFLGGLDIETFELGFDKIDAWVRGLLVQELYADLFAQWDVALVSKNKFLDSITTVLNFG
jgi:hypothetical protein